MGTSTAAKKVDVRTFTRKQFKLKLQQLDEKLFDGNKLEEDDIHPGEVFFVKNEIPVAFRTGNVIGITVASEVSEEIDKYKTKTCLNMARDAGLINTEEHRKQYQRIHHRDNRNPHENKEHRPNL